jgi:hypothetical protein
MLVVVIFGGGLTIAFDAVTSHYKLAERLAAFLKEQEENIFGDVKREINWYLNNPSEAILRAHGMSQY